MPVLDDVATYIAGQGLGTIKTGATQAVQWLIYKAVTPPGDAERAGPSGVTDDCISITSYAGGAPLEVMGSGSTGVVAEQPRFQVLVRSYNYSSAMAKAEALWTAIHNYSGTLSGTRYLRIECLQSPFPIGRDDATRFLIGFNCVAWKERG